MKKLNYSNYKIIMSYRGFKFYKTDQKNNRFQEWNHKMHICIDLSISMLRNYYMKSMNVFSFDSIRIINLKNNPSELYNMIKKVKSVFDEPIVRIDALHGSTYIHILDSNNDKDIQFSIIDTTPDYIKIRICNINNDGLFANDPIYLGKNDNLPPYEDDSEGNLLLFPSNKYNINFWNKLGFVYGAMKKLYSNSDKIKTHDIDPYLLAWMPMIIQEETKGIKADSYIFDISHYISDQLDKNMKSTYFEFLSYINYQDWEQYPLVDLNDREYTFIDHYVRENTELFTKDKSFNLNEYLSNATYGNKYRFINDKIDKDYLISYEIKDDNKIIFELLFPLKNDNFMTIIQFITSNTDHFNFNSAIAEIGVSFVIKAKNLKEMKMLPNYSDMIEEVPSWVNDIKGSWAAILIFISIMIVMHDRPNRTKCIVEQTPRNINPNKKSSSHNEKDYVIRRILKTSSDAKEFLKNKTGTRGSAEYTIESWHRIGHWRTYKSGKKVWIGETECTRHKELSKKEIHIKL